ncbi:MAG: hypothetical protein PVI81_01480 [Anaerolineales bacterium]|jgi:hypothetical protein
MRWEALLWSVLAMTTPAAAQLLWRRFAPRLPDWAQPLTQGASWLHALILPYLALIVGSIPGRLVGLYGIDTYEWFAGGLACLCALLAVYFTYRLRPLDELRPRSAVDRWKDEPRWALYRATAGLWIQDITLGAGLGLILAATEWLLTALAHDSGNISEQDPEPLYRSAVSTALFILTQNFWLTAGTQLIFFLLLETWSRQTHISDDVIA